MAITLDIQVGTWIISALPFATPEATVPMPASATSLTDTFAFGLICLFRWKLYHMELSLLFVSTVY